MHQLAQIADIIENTIEEMVHDSYGLHEGEAAQKLVKASLDQLTALLDSTLEVNKDGDTVLNLGSLL